MRESATRALTTAQLRIVSVGSSSPWFCLAARCKAFGAEVWAQCESCPDGAEGRPAQASEVGAGLGLGPVCHFPSLPSHVLPPIKWQNLDSTLQKSCATARKKNRPAGPAPSLARLEGLRHLWRSALPGACKLASSEPSSCCNIAAQAFAVSSDLEGHRKCSEREIFLKTGLHWLERSAVNSIARMTT